MNEANKPTVATFPDLFNCDNLTALKPANCADAELPNEQPIASEYSVEVHFDVSVYPAESESVGWSAFSNWVEAAENGVASLSPHEVASLIALIQEMRCSNTNLLERTIQLEQALAESQSDLQSHKQRSRAAESILNQQTQELTAAQEQVKDLSDELETADQTIKRHQVLIENLTTKLETSQERIAQMERECSLTQANYNEKFHQLLQTENSCRELRARLVRQQRYTMQLKFALEKCMESPARSYQSPADSDSLPVSAAIGQTIYSQPGESVFPKAQPITPWSSPAPSFSDELERPWTESDVGSQWISNEEQLTTDRNRSTRFDSTPCPGAFELENDSTTTQQNFFFTEDVGAAEDTDWEDLFSLLEAEAEKETTNSADLLVDIFASASDIKSLAQMNEEQDRSNFAYQESKSGAEIGVSEKTNQFQPPESPQPKTSHSPVNPNWPSPVVYPCQPAKGRKSLSAIELPNFAKRK